MTTSAKIILDSINPTGSKSSYQKLVESIEDIKHLSYEERLELPCVLCETVNNRGYGRVYANNKYFTAHRLATEIMDGPPPDDKPWAIHGPCHNRACIIHCKWGSQKENMVDRVRDKTKLVGVETYQAKLTEEQVIEIHVLCKEMYYSITKIAEMYNISHRTVSMIHLGTGWKHLGLEPLPIRASHVHMAPSNVIEAHNLLNSTTLSYDEISDITGMSVQAIRVMFRGLTYKNLGPVIRPKQQINSNLLKVVQLLNTTTLTYKQISELTNLSKTTVAGICQGTRHVYLGPINRPTESNTP